jgi:hypothetical protein
VNEGKSERMTVVMATILLALRFIWRLMPSDEVPSSTLNALSILIELGMFVGVIGLVPRILRSLPEGAPRGGWISLLVVAIISSVGIFGLRLSGGPRVDLPSRHSSTDDKGLRRQLHQQLVSLENLSNKLRATRWLQTFVTQDPVKIRTLTREDLQEERVLCRQIRDSADGILKIFADATAKGVAHSTLSDEPGATRPETWKATRELYSSTYDYLSLIASHWDEWLADPFPPAGSDLKPWQVEIQRLIDAATASAREADAQLMANSPSLAANDDVALPHQLRDALQLCKNASDKVLATRWVKLGKDPAQTRTRTREDLQEMRRLYSELPERVDRVMKILAEAKRKGTDLSMAWPAEPKLTRLEFWSAMRQSHQAGLEMLALIDQHWEEWKALPHVPDEKNMKPWERELRRLEAVNDAKVKEAQVVEGPSASTPAPFPTLAPSLPGNGFDQGAYEAHMLPAVRDYVVAMKRLQATNWIKNPDANPRHPQNITRADLHDANEKLRDLIAAVDKLRKDLAAYTGPVPLAEKEFWRMKKETNLAFQQQTKLLEENWKEWHVSGIEPKSGKPKPWQKEAIRLETEIKVLSRVYGTSVLL